MVACHRLRRVLRTRERSDRGWAEARGGCRREGAVQHEAEPQSRGASVMSARHRPGFLHASARAHPRLAAPSAARRDPAHESGSTMQSGAADASPSGLPAIGLVTGVSWRCPEWEVDHRCGIGPIVWLLAGPRFMGECEVGRRRRFWGGSRRRRGCRCSLRSAAKVVLDKAGRCPREGEPVARGWRGQSHSGRAEEASRRRKGTARRGCTLGSNHDRLPCLRPARACAARLERGRHPAVLSRVGRDTTRRVRVRVSCPRCSGRPCLAPRGRSRSRIPGVTIARASTRVGFIEPCFRLAPGPCQTRARSG
jgi:hypothetical protein